MGTMQVTDPEDAGTFHFWQRNYRPEEERPSDLMVIVSDGECCQAMSWIGPAADYWCDEVGRSEHEIGEWPPGVWITKFHLRDTSGWTDYGWEADSEPAFFDDRKLTEHEWEMFRECPEEGPWDLSLWTAVEENEANYAGPEDYPDGWLGIVEFEIVVGEETNDGAHAQE